MDEEVQRRLDELPRTTKQRQSQDKDYLLAVLSLLAWIDKRLGKLGKGITAGVTKHIDADLNIDKTSLYKIIGDQLDEFFNDYTGELEDTVVTVGKAKARVELARVRAAGIPRREVSILSEQFADGNEKLPTRFKTFRWEDGRNYTQRIKTIKEGTEKVVISIIENGVKEQKSARDIAKDINQYLKPVEGSGKVAPRDVYRTRFKRPTNYVPRVPSGSLQYNAVRIARTESARIYREIALQYYKGKDWVTGFKWVLSNSHEKVDECDEYAIHIYPNVGSLPIAPHPNCLCDVQPVINRGDQ